MAGMKLQVVLDQPSHHALDFLKSKLMTGFSNSAFFRAKVQEEARKNGWDPIIVSGVVTGVKEKRPNLYPEIDTRSTDDDEI